MPLLSLQDNYLNHLSFLAPYEPLWNNEVLNSYPYSLTHYSPEWLEFLGQLSEENLHKIDAFLDLKEIESHSFGKFCLELRKLVHLPQQKINSHQLPIKAFDKIKDKKEYEIGILAPYIAELFQKEHLSQVIDIGSGVGNLARVLANYFDIKTTCLEKDFYFHSLGKKYIEQYSTPEGIKNIEFKQLALEEWHEEALSLIDPNALIIGLHACGSLSQRVLETSKLRHPKCILNFGCCYLHMNPENDLNLSSFAKNHPHHIKYHGLTLAARQRSGFSFAEFQLKKRVKDFRYALHLFLYHEAGIKEFVSVGDSKPRDYQQDFAFYAQKKLKKLNSKLNFHDEILNNFYKSPSHQKNIKQMFLADIIRAQFGRVLEHLILLDRAIYLEEQGYDVTLSTFFDETISPRNRGIFGKRKV